MLKCYHRLMKNRVNPLINTSYHMQVFRNECLKKKLIF
uniref:Uncharacterized protein n=1 Tax=Anguilla anguilla TaxID=7936 RepID=A0A0E9WK72_ANGAN